VKYIVQKAVKYRFCEESESLFNWIFFTWCILSAHTRGRIEVGETFLVFISLRREYSASAFNIIQEDTVGNCSYVQLHPAFWDVFKFNHTILFSIFY